MPRQHFRAQNLEMALEHLGEYIKAHEEMQVPRLARLKDYYNAENDIVNIQQRRMTDRVADNRLAHPFAEYIVNYIQGYAFGEPIQMTTGDGSDIEPLKEIAERNDEGAHNSELGLDLGIYGRAYELLYRSEDSGEVRLVRLDPLNTFVIYDESIENYSIAGVRYFTLSDNTDVVEVYTHEAVLRYEDEDDFTKPTTISPHAFGSVPINEYGNGRERQGDFEKVLALIDAYDGAQSDLANYSEDLNDAILAILGDVELDAENLELMRDSRILLGRPSRDVNGRESNISADYIYKKYDATGAEAYKDRLKNDIHTFTHTPNMADDKFAGNQSGEAMKYKLFNLEQKRINKINAFLKSLRRRWRLVIQMSGELQAGLSIEPEELRFVTKANLPIDVKGELDAFTKAGGELSQQTLIGLFPFGVDADEERERIEEETPQGVGYPMMFGGDGDGDVSDVQSNNDRDSTVREGD